MFWGCWGWAVGTVGFSGFSPGGILASLPVD